MRQHFKSYGDFISLLRKNFFTGVFALIPIGVVIWILAKVARALWTLQYVLPEEWRPEHYFDPVTSGLLNFLITILLTFVFVVLVSVFGWASKQFVGKKFLAVLSLLIQRIPVVRAIYSSLNQLLKTMATSDRQQFSRVVYLEYPRAGSYALAFVTGSAKSVNGSSPFLNVYVPTTPNPTSGFHLIVPESEVKDANLSVEEAFKTILSLGIAQKEDDFPGARA